MFPFVSQNKIHFVKIIIIIIIIILTLTTCLYLYTDETDFAHLPPKTKSKLIDDRFVALFYYNSSVHGGLGDAMIYPISNFAKLYTSVYLIIIASGIFTALAIQN